MPGEQSELEVPCGQDTRTELDPSQMGHSDWNPLRHTLLVHGNLWLLSFLPNWAFPCFKKDVCSLYIERSLLPVDTLCLALLGTGPVPWTPCLPPS